MSLAVIKTGGKQYLVEPGKKIKVEKLEVTEGKEVIFDEVLLSVSGTDKLQIGEPMVPGTKVIGKVLKQGRGEKLLVYKYKPKKRYHLKKGHRQAFTEVEITKV